MLLLILLQLLYTGASAEMSCTTIPEKLKQLDAGNGDVFGVSDEGSVYFWHSDRWRQIKGNYLHVTVGPAGVWAVDKNNLVYRLQNFEWIQVSGLLKQIDAGGDTFLVGVNAEDNIYCLNQESIKGITLSYKQIKGKLMYYSCGPHGCWGVNNVYEVYYQNNVTQTSCKGTGSVRVPGSSAMVEVGTDGSVFGVTKYGEVIRRVGISPTNPMGTTWKSLELYGNFKHVSYDAGFLWIIAENGRVIRCPYPESILPSLL
ncbi:fish-egg lectin-like [Xenopus laevis]|uniref:Fish-egg lectin-like n=1 Tax=Xenopus laevis TaxID=8355 RepID=A0A8J1LDD8_XENLA|nr:fish-egg lectin-like [Xenopus laevis]